MLAAFDPTPPTTTQRRSLIAGVRATFPILLAVVSHSTTIRSCQCCARAAKTEHAPQGTYKKSCEGLPTRRTAGQCPGQLVKIAGRHALSFLLSSHKVSLSGSLHDVRLLAENYWDFTTIASSSPDRCSRGRGSYLYILFCYEYNGIREQCKVNRLLCGTLLVPLRKTITYFCL